jgi:hypothetical protein
MFALVGRSFKLRRSDLVNDERFLSNLPSPPPTTIVAGSPSPAPPSEIPVAADVPDIRTPDTSAMELFFFWEKLRLILNLPLIVVASCAMSRLGEFCWLILGCNLYFCLGPVLEGYLCWFGVPRGGARLLSLGLLPLLACLGGCGLLGRQPDQ